MIETDNFKKVEVTSPKELRAWLLENHSTPDSVWLVTYKKIEATKYVSRWEVLDSYTNVKEISLAVGFKRQDYFAKEFYKRYANYPKEYLS